MPPVKLDIFPLPDLREIDDRVWFKIKLDDKMKWVPDKWQDPARDEDVEAVLSDKELGSLDEHAARLAAITGRSDSDCRRALREGKWWSSANRYISFTAPDFKKQLLQPIRSSSRLFWLYRNRLVKVVGRRTRRRIGVAGATQGSQPRKGTR